MAIERSIVWIDAGGNLTITRVKTNTGASTIQADMLAKSNADYNDYWEGTDVINATPAPTSAQYLNVRSAALLTFLCADGTDAVLRLIAPQVGIFESDQVTVDATTIATLIADCIGNLMSPSGSLAVSYTAGTLATR